MELDPLTVTVRVSLFEALLSRGGRDFINGQTRSREDLRSVAEHELEHRTHVRLHLTSGTSDNSVSAARQ